MVKGVRLSQEELVRQFPISRRLALRVVALLKHQLECSSIVLEEASKGTEFERLLLSRDLFQLVQSQDWHGLEEWIQEANLRDPLALLIGEDSRVVVLEEELLALDDPGEFGLIPTQQGGLIESSTPAIQLSRVEADQIFSSETLSQLKVDLVTSSNPNLRMEALRKIAFSQISPEEKERIFLGVLRDKEEEVRREAIQSMIALGLHPDLVTPLGKLLGSSSQSALQSATTLLKTPLPPLDIFSQVVLISSCLRAMELFSEIEIKMAILDVLGDLGPLDFLRGESLVNFGKTLLEKNKENHFQLLEKISRILTNISRGEKGEMMDFLWQKIRTLDRGFQRTLILRVALNTAPKVFSPEVAPLILQGELMDFLTQKTKFFLFGDFLQHHFQEAMEALLPLIQKDDPGQRRALELLENLVCQVKPPKKEWNDLCEKIIQAIPTGSLALVSWSLKSKIMNTPKLPQKLREKFARALVYHLGESQFAPFRQSVMDLILRLGKSSISPLLAFLGDRAIGENLRKEGGVTLAQLVLGLKTEQRGSRKLFQKVLKTLIRLYKLQPPGLQKSIAKILGPIAQSPLAGPVEVEAIYNLLMETVGRAAHTFEICQGLSLLVQSPHLGQAPREKLANMFLLLLGRKLPDHTANVKIQTGEVIFEENIHARLHTDLMPFLLAGLQELCTTSQGPMKRLIQKTLLVKWQRVSSFEEVWSPFNTQHLTECLEKIASHPQTPLDLQRDIAQNFLDFFQEREELIMAPALVAIFAATSQIKQMEPLALSFSHILLKVAKELTLHQETEISLPEIYHALSKLLARGYFEGPAKKALRDSLVQLLLQGLRNSHLGAKEGISLIVEHTKNQSLRKELTKYLQGSH